MGTHRPQNPLTRIGVALGAAGVLACGAPDRPDMHSSGRPELLRLSGAALNDSLFAARCTAAFDSVISPSGAGPARMWMSVSRLRSACAARDTSVESVGLPAAAVAALAVGADRLRLVAFYADEEHPTVRAIYVTNARYMTAAGIGPGGTVRALRNAYADLCLANSGTALLAHSQSLPGVSFVLRSAGNEDSLTVTGLELERIPDDTRIAEVWVHTSDFECGR